MRGIVAALAVAWVLGSALGAPVQLSQAAEKALCPVCRVMEGADEEEAVHATREFGGTRYGFCSDECAKAFDADPAAFVPPVFPRLAPELAVTTLTGDSLRWSALRGRVVLVDFWATWCAPCRKSMPELQALHDEYGERGFTVLGISIDEGDPKKVRKFIESNRITYPIAIDSADRPAWARFHVKSIPAAFLVDAEGRIIAQWTGVSTDTQEVEEKLGGLLGSKTYERPQGG